MQTAEWFCTTCGAANDSGQAVCFACQQRRVENTQPEESSGLLQERYRLLIQVGVGGFGVVYKALDTRFADHVVAIKQINLRGLSPQKMIEATDAFNREVHILPVLKHPNLPRIYDHFTDADHWYLVMDFLEGQTLERYLESRLLQRSYSGTAGLLPLEEILALAFQLCDVLEYLHARQPPIIFRDLKPANMMLNGRGRLFLIDFGIARLFTPGQARDTTPLGSPGYAAPEQYGKAQTTPRSDLYSLGALLHHLVTGDDPTETPFQFAPLPETSAPAMQQMDALIRRLVDVDSSQRPASAREVKAELQHVAYLAADSQPRIWFPPQGQTPDPVSTQNTFMLPGATGGQQQVQAQLHQPYVKGATRRTFLARGLVGGAVLLVGTTLLGPTLLSLLGGNDQGQRIFGMNNGSDPQNPYRDQQSISAISWSPDGTQAAFVATTKVASDNSNTYDIQNTVSVEGFVEGMGGNYYPNLPEMVGSYITALTWAPDSRHIALGYFDGSIWLLDTKNETQPINYSGTLNQVQSIAWSPDNKLIAVGSVNEAALIINASDGTVVSIYSGSSVSESLYMSWSPDSKRIVIEYGALNSKSINKTLQVWDAIAGKTLFSFGYVNMLQVAWSPAGNIIASAGSDGKVYLWDATNGKLITSYAAQNPPYPDQLPIIVWSPDGKYLALDTGDNSIQVWNAQSGTSKLFHTELSPPRAMTWLDGRLELIDAARIPQYINVNGI